MHNHPLSTLVLMALVLMASLLGTAACTGDATDIREEEFRLTLPGQWTGGYDAPSDAWIYVTASREEGLTVRVQRRNPAANAARLESEFNDYLQVRRRDEQQFSDERMALSEPALQRRSGAITATYDGIGKTSQRRTRTLIAINLAAAGSFYYEAFGLSEDQFTARAKAVLQRARLVQ